MIPLTVELDLAAMERALAPYERALDDQRPALDAAVEEVYRAAEEIFQGGFWAPIRPMTRARYNRPPVGALLSSPHLRESWTGGAGSVKRYEGTNAVIVGSADRAAKYHEFGYPNYGYYPGGRGYRARWMRGTPVVARPVRQVILDHYREDIVTAFRQAFQDTLRQRL
jgi:hypothetical protein